MSRDILNFAGKDRLALADYYARSSIAALASKPADLDDESFGRIASDFQRRMVRRDLDKSLMHDLAKRQDFDFILIDLIDERFDLYEMAPGAIATISSEFLLTRHVTSRDRSSERWIRSASDEHKALWKSGVEKLFGFLAEQGIADRVIVNKVFWADRMEDGSPVSEEVAVQCHTANALLAWMYDELERYVPPARWLRFPPSVLKSSPMHRWGPAPFHYPDAYYAEAVNQLQKLYEERRVDGGAALDERTIVAWSGLSSHACRRSSFLVFRDKVLIHTRPYSVIKEMQFDIGGVAGDYEVVVFTLIFDPAAQGHPAVRREKSILSFRSTGGVISRVG